MLYIVPAAREHFHVKYEYPFEVYVDLKASCGVEMWLPSRELVVVRRNASRRRDLLLVLAGEALTARIW